MYPENLKYTKEHEWLKVEDDIATIGITFHAQERLNDVVFVELPKVGKSVKKRESIAVLESVKAVSDVYSPVSGEVIEINDSLVNKPELINQKPYSDGWIVKLKVRDIKELDGLLTAKEYEELIERK